MDLNRVSSYCYEVVPSEVHNTPVARLLISFFSPVAVLFRDGRAHVSRQASTGSSAEHVQEAVARWGVVPEIVDGRRLDQWALDLNV